jgi:hypothetical protein
VLIVAQSVETCLPSSLPPKARAQITVDVSHPSVMRTDKTPSAAP